MFSRILGGILGWGIITYFLIFHGAFIILLIGYFFIGTILISVSWYVIQDSIETGRWGATIVAALMLVGGIGIFMY